MEEDFTGGAIHDQPTRRQWSVDPPFDARVRQLVRDWDASESPELIEEMIVTALKMMPMAEAVSVPFFNQHVDAAAGTFDPGEVQARAATVMLDELLRWAGALRPLRS